jgi:hypothetical protein
MAAPANLQSMSEFAMVLFDTHFQSTSSDLVLIQFKSCRRRTGLISIASNLHQHRESHQTIQQPYSARLFPSPPGSYRSVASPTIGATNSHLPSQSPSPSPSHNPNIRMHSPALACTLVLSVDTYRIHQCPLVSAEEKGRAGKGSRLKRDAKSRTRRYTCMLAHSAASIKLVIHTALRHQQHECTAYLYTGQVQLEALLLGGIRGA